MDPSAPDFFRRARLAVQLPIIAICSGIGGALYFVAILDFREMVQAHLKWPQGAMDFARLFAACWILFKFVPNHGIFASFVFLPKIEEDFELNFSMPLPPRLPYLLPGIRTGAFAVVAAVAYVRGFSDLLRVPLSVFSPEQLGTVQLVYAFLVPTLIKMFTPDISIGFFGPSVTAALANLLVYPYEAWTKRRVLALSHTFVAVPSQARISGSSFPAFQYKGIYEPGIFRLLRLTPENGEMSVHLEHFPVDACPPYWAISYTWGSDNMNRLLKVSPCRASNVLDPILSPKSSSHSKRYIKITESCANVLIRLTPLQTRYLWIDSICINQADRIEKGVQIMLMAQIYSKAQQVVGCLAPDQVAVPAGQIPLSQSFLFDLIRYLRFNPDTTQLRLPYLHRKADWAGFCLLLMHPYWSRTWIVQETVLAKKLIIVYGEASFSWPQFANAINRLWERTTTGKIPNMDKIHALLPLLSQSLTVMSDRVDMLSGLRRSVQSSDQSQWPPLAQVMDRAYRTDCKDPRDQVFAMLSLASDREAPELKPNYDKSVTYEHVICRAVSHSFKNGHLALFLSAGLAYRYDEQGSDLPSWIPAFPKIARRREGNWALDEARKAPRQIEFAMSPNFKELTVHGVVADQVAILCPMSMAQPPDQYHADWKRDHPESEELGFWNDYMAELPSRLPAFLIEAQRFVRTHISAQYPNHMTREEAYWRAMAMDWDGVKLGGKSPATAASKSLFYDVQNALAFQDKASMKRVVSDLQTSPNFDGLPFNHWAFYELAVTRSGHLAWVPQRSQVGDILCFLQGLEVPLSLRRTGPEDAEQYLLIGDAFIQGLMHGEANELQGDRPFNIV